MDAELCRWGGGGHKLEVEGGGPLTLHSRGLGGGRGRGGGEAGKAWQGKGVILNNFLGGFSSFFINLFSWI